MGHFSFQLADTVGGKIFYELKPGDEITLLAGYGEPAIDKDRTEIIAGIAEMSGVTANGVILRCHDGTGIRQTGKHFDKYSLSQLAQDILDYIKSIEDVNPDLKFDG